MVPALRAVYPVYIETFAEEIAEAERLRADRFTKYISGGVN